MGKDYYKTLGIAREATPEEIKKAHRKLARKYHPDLNPGDKKAEEQFKAIQEAYDVLSEPEKRAKYDRFGDQWQNAGFGGAATNGTQGGATGAAGASPFVNVDLGGAGVNFEDFFERMFGGGGSKAKSAADFFHSAAPAEDVIFSIDISLEDAYRGASHRINVTVEDVCPDCEGVGQRRNKKGQFDLTGAACPRCRGRGRIDSPRTGSVTIPAGAWEGLRLKLAGQGAADAKGARGDLLIQLHIKPHPKFERDGQDLLFDVAVPYTIAALGGEVTVETLGGHKRQLLVPTGIQTGQKLRLTGQGMPALQDRRAGDAYARVKITVPRDLSDHERMLLEELARLRDESVRIQDAKTATK